MAIFDERSWRLEIDGLQRGVNLLQGALDQPEVNRADDVLVAFGDFAERAVM